MIIRFGILKEQNKLADFNVYEARRLLPLWKSVISNTKEFCDATMLNFESFSNKRLNVYGNKNSAEAKYTDFFTDEDLRYFDITV